MIAQLLLACVCFTFKEAALMILFLQSSQAAPISNSFGNPGTTPTLIRRKMTWSLVRVGHEEVNAGKRLFIRTRGTQSWKIIVDNRICLYLILSQLAFVTLNTAHHWARGSVRLWLFICCYCRSKSHQPTPAFQPAVRANNCIWSVSPTKETFFSPVPPASRYEGCLATLSQKTTHSTTRDRLHCAWWSCLGLERHQILVEG